MWYDNVVTRQTSWFSCRRHQEPKPRKPTPTVTCLKEPGCFKPSLSRVPASFDSRQLLRSSLLRLLMIPNVFTDDVCSSSKFRLHISLCVCVCVCCAVDVNQTEPNEMRFICLHHLHIGNPKQSITRLLWFAF